MSVQLIINNPVPSFRLMASTQLPTRWCTFQLHAFSDDRKEEHLALTLGNVSGEVAVLTRVHSECLTGDALFSQRCDCGDQLAAAMDAISREGRGLILYLRQEGRGIGLLNKLRAYELQDEGLDTIEANERLGFAADERDYAVCRPILEQLGVQRLRLMTNNPEKIAALRTMGFEVTERVPLRAGHCAANARYLATKARRFGHLLADDEVDPHGMGVATL